MVAMNNRYVRVTFCALIILFIYYIINGIKTAIEEHQKEIFEYPIYEAFDDVTVILIKVFTDVCIIFSIILTIIVRTFKRRQLEKQNMFMILSIIATLLKCFDMLLFVIISFLFLHGVIDEMFEETSSVLMFAVFHSIGYFISVPTLYHCVGNLNWTTKSAKLKNRNQEEEVDYIFHC